MGIFILVIYIGIFNIGSWLDNLKIGKILQF